MGALRPAPAGGLRVQPRNVTKRVSIVLVSTDEGHLLLPALGSLFAAPPSTDFEVVVIDNGSSIEVSAEVTKRWPDARVMRQTTRKSLAANLNLAMSVTDSVYAMWCDADMLFNPGAVDALARFLDEHPRAGMVKPKLLSGDGLARASARRWYTIGSLVASRGPWRKVTSNWPTVLKSRYADWSYRGPRKVDWLPFAGVMVRREAFQAVDGVDERFPFYFEDVDFSFRFHEAGWEVWCHPEAEMVHLENRASVDVFSRAGKTHLVSLIKFWWKHKGLRPRNST